MNIHLLLHRLYHDYKKADHFYNHDLGKFYLDYKPLVADGHMNCVGLTIELRKRLVEELHNTFPDIDKYLFYTAAEMRLAEGNGLLRRESLKGKKRL